MRPVNPNHGLSAARPAVRRWVRSVGSGGRIRSATFHSARIAQSDYWVALTSTRHRRPRSSPSSPEGSGGGVVGTDRSGRCSPRNDGRTRDSAALRAWRRSTSAGSTGYSGVRIIRPAARPPCGRAGARRRSARAARPRRSVRTSRAGETTGRERRDHRAPGWRLGLAHQWQQPREPSVAGVASRSAGWTSSGAALCSFRRTPRRGGRRVRAGLPHGRSWVFSVRDSSEKQFPSGSRASNTRVPATGSRISDTSTPALLSRPRSAVHRRAVPNAHHFRSRARARARDCPAEGTHPHPDDHDGGAWSGAEARTPTTFHRAHTRAREAATGRGTYPTPSRGS